MGKSNTIPDRIGRYRIISQLGKGAMATVYRAIQEGPHGFEPEVALKLFDPALVASQPAVVGMIVDEARIASRLKHPGIVRILDLVEDDGQLYTVMDCVDGPSMRQILDAARLSRRAPAATAIVAVLAAACEGLHAAHTTPHPDGSASGLVHRDIKPGNILVTRQGEVRVSDFGIAIFSDRVADATAQGQLKGTPAYMSPEQVFGEPMDARSDIFSMGLTLFSLCTTRLAFTGESPMKIAVRIAEEPMDAQAEELDGLLPGLGDIFNKACAKDPSDRYDSAKALGAALTKIYAAQENPVTILDLLETWWETTSSQELETEKQLAEAPFLDEDEPETDPNLASIGPADRETEEDSTAAGDLSPTGRQSAAAGFADLDEAPTDEAPEASEEQKGLFQEELQALPTLEYDHDETDSRTTVSDPPRETPALGLSPLQDQGTLRHMPKGTIDVRPGQKTDSESSPETEAESSLVSQTVYRPERDYRGRVIKRKPVDPKSLIVSKGEKIAVAVTGGVLLLAVLTILILQQSRMLIPESSLSKAEETPPTAEPIGQEAEVQEPEVESAQEETPKEKPAAEPNDTSEAISSKEVIRSKSEEKKKPPVRQAKKKPQKEKKKERAQPKTKQEPAQASVEGTGTLTVNTYPYSKVWVNGKLIGQTPLRAQELAVGVHEVKLVFPTLEGREEVKTVRIRNNKDSKLVERITGEVE